MDYHNEELIAVDLCPIWEGGAKILGRSDPIIPQATEFRMMRVRFFFHGVQRPVDYLECTSPRPIRAAVRARAFPSPRVWKKGSSKSVSTHPLVVKFTSDHRRQGWGLSLWAPSKTNGPSIREEFIHAPTSRG